MMAFQSGYSLNVSLLLFMLRWHELGHLVNLNEYFCKTIFHLHRKVKGCLLSKTDKSSRLTKEIRMGIFKFPLKLWFSKHLISAKIKMTCLNHSTF